MAISSRINIDVDSAAFRSFQEKFDKYKESPLKQEPPLRHAEYIHLSGGAAQRNDSLRRYATWLPGQPFRNHLTANVYRS
jgi:hypothetical protein